MNELDLRIAKFLKKMHLASLAIVGEDGQAYAASSFYAFDEERTAIVVAGSSQTKHIKASLQTKIAGTIALDTRIVGRIEGLQFKATLNEADEHAKKIYFRRFAYAMAMKPEIWQINLEWIKYTSNLLGFGKKIIWTRQAQT